MAELLFFLFGGAVGVMAVKIFDKDIKEAMYLFVEVLVDVLKEKGIFINDIMSTLITRLSDESDNKTAEVIAEVIGEVLKNSNDQ